MHNMQLDAHFLEENGEFESKFLRAGNEVYVTEADDLKTLHIELAGRDKVLDRIEHLIMESKDEVDGGIIFVSGKIIQIGSHSTSLSLPITKKARKETLQKLKQQFPDYNIKELVQESGN